METVATEVRSEECQYKIDSCCSKGALLEPGVEVGQKKVNKVAWRLAFGLVIASQTMMLGLGINMTPPGFGTTTYWTLHSLLIAFVFLVMGLLGRELLRESWKSFVNRRVSVEGLFVLSIAGALAGSMICTFTGTGNVYYEVVVIVLVIYTICKTLGARSREKAIKESTKVREEFDAVYVLNAYGEREKMPIEQVGCCCDIVVGPGEAIAIDGVILDGEAFIKETVMTGELEPVVRGVGDFVLAGSYSVDGVITIKPTALKGDRKLDTLIKTVEGARLAPSALQEQADQMMKRFLPLVVTVCLATFGVWVFKGTWEQALFNSMAVLLVACPCALGLATPLAVWRGLWKLSTLGLVSKSGEFLDVLARANRIIFDKTGTLSEENLRVVDYVIKGRCEEIITMVRLVESRVEHPVARALSQLGKEVLNNSFLVKSVKEIPGNGIEGVLLKRDEDREIKIKIGNKNFMPEIIEIEWDKLLEQAVNSGVKKRVYISIDGLAEGIIFLDEKIREGTSKVFNELKKLGLKGAIMTGDNSSKWENIEGVKIEKGVSPSEKVERVTQFEEQGDWVIFVGDGVNDAAAMAVSRASIAMGGGAALTHSTASAVLMGGTLEPLPKAIKVCRAVRRNVRGNILFAVVYNCIGMGLAALGMLHPVVAALLMLVSSLCVSIRAIRGI